MSTIKEFIKSLKKVREEVGLTQLQVAEKAGLDVNYYARIERGEIKRPGYKTIVGIAQALKLKLPN